MNKRLMYGVGMYEKGEFAASAGGKTISNEYSLWASMLCRCYSEKSLVKNPTYSGCTVSDNFKNFQYFAEWCQSQIGFNFDGYTLDKDILIKGNKIYSEDTCFFVPRKINNFILTTKASRGDLPLGVCFHKQGNKFMAQCSDFNGLNKYLGLFATPEEAFQAYKAYKESLAKEFAKAYIGKVDDKIINVLNNYTVEITD